MLGDTHFVKFVKKQLKVQKIKAWRNADSKENSDFATITVQTTLGTHVNPMLIFYKLLYPVKHVM